MLTKKIYKKNMFFKNYNRLIPKYTKITKIYNKIIKKKNTNQLFNAKKLVTYETACA